MTKQMTDDEQRQWERAHYSAFGWYPKGAVFYRDEGISNDDTLHGKDCPPMAWDNKAQAWVPLVERGDRPDDWLTQPYP